MAHEHGEYKETAVWGQIRAKLRENVQFTLHLRTSFSKNYTSSYVDLKITGICLFIRTSFVKGCVQLTAVSFVIVV